MQNDDSKTKFINMTYSYKKNETFYSSFSQSRKYIDKKIITMFFFCFLF
jgi:hypothetical protein